MCVLPRCDHVLSPSAGRWLGLAAAVLLPLDILLFEWGCSQVFLIWILLSGPLNLPLANFAVADVARFTITAFTLALLLCTGCVTARDVGLTVGKPRLTLFWVAFPAAVVSATWLVFGLTAWLVVRYTGWVVPIHTTDLHETDRVWLTVFSSCVTAPLVEELLYRGVLVPALEGLGGGRLALLGSGVIFAVLHLIYGRPAVAMPHYFLSGVVLAWSFLRSRSLLPPLLLHSIGNLFVVAKDYVILQYPEWVIRVVGYPLG
jgi:membrane protease YdiL (CAAX protease family)